MSDVIWQPDELCGECGASKAAKPLGGGLVSKLPDKFPCEAPCESCRARSAEAFRRLGERLALDRERAFWDAFLGANQGAA